MSISNQRSPCATGPGVLIDQPINVERHKIGRALFGSVLEHHNAPARAMGFQGLQKRPSLFPKA
jgi:hypothetical protein